MSPFSSLTVAFAEVFLLQAFKSSCISELAVFCAALPELKRLVLPLCRR